MELRHLRAFVAAYDTGHFGSAASRLYITQPALSQRIQRLERELGCALFRRRGRGIEVTEFGEALIPHARRLLDEEAHALETIRALACGEGGRVLIGFFAAGNLTLPLQLVQRFREQRPDATVIATEGFSASNVEKIRKGQLDAAFVRLPLNGIDGLDAIVVDQEPYGVVLPRDHTLTRKRSVALKELAGERWILFPREMNPAQHQEIAALIQVQTGEPVDLAEPATSEEAMVAAVTQGLGVCLRSRSRSRQLRASGVAYRPITPPAPIATLALISRPREVCSPLVRGFIELVVSGQNA